MGTVPVMPVSNEKMDGNPLGTLTVTRRLLNTSRRGPQNDRPVPRTQSIRWSWRFGMSSYTKIIQNLYFPTKINSCWFFPTQINSCWLNFEFSHVGTWNNHLCPDWIGAFPGLSKLSPRFGEACRSAGEALSVLGGIGIKLGS